MATQLAQAWSSIFRPKDRRPIYEWAADNIKLPPGLTMPGRFDVSRSRHFIEIFHALADDYVRQVCIRKPVRGGGTLISDIWHCWNRDIDAGPSMAIFQSDKIAEDHAVHRLIWMMTNCDRIRSLLHEDRHRLKNSEITFADGLPIYVTGPGINNLQTRGIRYLSISEAWIKEVGSMVGHACGRMGDFERMGTNKLLMDSQAGREEDAFDVKWTEGDQCWWNVPCLGCGHYAPPRWSGFRKDGTRFGMMFDECKDERGRWDIPKALPTIRFECGQCGHKHLDSAAVKAEWNRRGKYVAENPGASKAKRSFHWSALIADSWEGLVEKYLSAMNAYKLGVLDLLIEFFQQRMAEPASEGSVHEKVANIPQADYEVTSEWKDEAYRFMTIDVQESEFWIVIRAWSKFGESRKLYCGQKFSWSDIEALQAEFKVDNHRVLIDSGFRTREVYSQCCAHGAWKRFGKQIIWFGWRPCKGVEGQRITRSGKSGPIESSYSDPAMVDAEIGRAGAGPNQCQMFRWQTMRIKDRMAQLLKRNLFLSATGKSAMEDEYKRQMAGEVKVKEKNEKTGRDVWIWKKVRANHLFDCEALQVLAATMGGILPDESDALELAA